MKVGRFVRHRHPVLPSFSSPLFLAPDTSSPYQRPTLTNGWVIPGPGSYHVLQTKPTWGEKKDLYVLNHCSMKSSSESFIWVLKSNLRGTSQCLRPSRSPQTLHVRRSFTLGSYRLSERGGVSFKASPPSSSARPTHHTPTSRPTIVPSQLSLHAIQSSGLENLPVTQPILWGRTPHSLF